jgi:hypothetical protein
LKNHLKLKLETKNKSSATLVIFRIAGITISVKSDLPITPETFNKKFDAFLASDRRGDTVSLHHHFGIPDYLVADCGEKIYRKTPWAIFQDGGSWIYKGILANSREKLWLAAIFDAGHSHGHIFNSDEKSFLNGNLHSLSLFPTDQIWLARVLAKRQAFYFHAAGMKINGQGLLFAGHSEAGKSTTVTLLKNEGEILCDDRMIIRRWPAGFRVHGTWSHGDVPQVSAAEAPLRAILFLEKAKTNRLLPIGNPPEILKRILPLLIKPLVTADWWEKTLAVVEKLVREVPAYRLQFDKSGKIKEIIRELVADNKNKNKPRRQSRLP